MRNPEVVFGVTKKPDRDIEPNQLTEVAKKYFNFSPSAKWQTGEILRDGVYSLPAVQADDKIKGFKIGFSLDTRKNAVLVAEK